MNPILETVEFFHALRTQMRFGEFSRLPIEIRRFQIQDHIAECDWFMRPADPWDVHLTPALRQKHRTEQALHDALKVRQLIFRGFPKVQRANLRMYRPAAEPELMLIGQVERESRVRRVASLVMRAQLCGFRFSLTGGVLQHMPPTEFKTGF